MQRLSMIREETPEKLMLNKNPKILVGTDFSSHSDVVLKAAEDFRRKLNGSMDILHVSEHSIIWDWMPQEGLPYQLDARFESDLMQVLQRKIKSQIDRTGIKAQSSIAMGIPSSMIIQEVIDKNYDFLFMGHLSQQQGVFHVGSLTEKIVSTSPIPVVVIKNEQPPVQLAALIDPNAPMASTLTSSEDLALSLEAQHVVVSLFPDLTSRYVGVGKIGFSTKLLSLTDEQKNEIIDQITATIKSILRMPDQVKLIIEVSQERKLAFHLNEILKNHKIHWVIMKRHHSDFLEKVLIGSETRRMLEIFSGNLIILPP
jgi:nucleotide-binding universal stress UspA family protein